MNGLLLYCSQHRPRQGPFPMLLLQSCRPYKAHLPQSHGSTVGVSWSTCLSVCPDCMCVRLYVCATPHSVGVPLSTHMRVKRP